jgi:hypothetical protein
VAEDSVLDEEEQEDEKGDAGNGTMRAVHASNYLTHKARRT